MELLAPGFNCETGHKACVLQPGYWKEHAFISSSAMLYTCLCKNQEVGQQPRAATAFLGRVFKCGLTFQCWCLLGFALAVMDKNTAEGQTAAEVAQVVLYAVGQKKKEVLVAGLKPSLAVYLRNLFPRLFFNLMATRAKKERKTKDS